MLRRLSVFAGPFAIESAQAVFGNQLPTEQVIELPGRLVDRSLIAVEQRPTGRYYRLLETIRQMAGQKLKEAEDGEAVSRRFLAYEYHCSVEVAAWRSGDWMKRQRHDVDQENLLQALAWCRANDDIGLAVRVIEGTIQAWDSWAAFNKLSTWRAVILANEERLSPSDRVMGIRLAGGMAAMDGELELAWELRDRALAWARRCGDPDRLSYVLVQRAWLLIAAGDNERALQCVIEGQQIRRDQGWPSCTPSSNLCRAQILTNLGRDDEALPYWEEGWRGSQQMDCLAGVPFALRGLGMAALKRGDVALAADYLRQSLATAMGRYLGETIRALDALAVLAARLHRYEQAAILCGAADAAYRRYRLGRPADGVAENQAVLARARAAWS